MCDNGRLSTDDEARGAILPADAVCTHRSGLVFRRGCGLPAIGQCVYCGDIFCDTHGVLLEEYHEVCARRECRAKYADVQQHREWVRRQYQRNVQGICAVETCEEAPAVGCQRCHLRFCLDHVRPKTVTQRSLNVTAREQQMLCPHCTERRKLWD